VLESVYGEGGAARKQASVVGSAGTTGARGALCARFGGAVKAERERTHNGLRCGGLVAGRWSLVMW
jgi:hypothetical protein